MDPDLGGLLSFLKGLDITFNDLDIMVLSNP